MASTRPIEKISVNRARKKNQSSMRTKMAMPLSLQTSKFLEQQKIRFNYRDQELPLLMNLNQFTRRANIRLLAKLNNQKQNRNNQQEIRPLKSKKFQFSTTQKSLNPLYHSRKLSNQLAIPMTISPLQTYLKTRALRSQSPIGCTSSQKKKKPW